MAERKLRNISRYKKYCCWCGVEIKHNCFYYDTGESTYLDENIEECVICNKLIKEFNIENLRKMKDIYSALSLIWEKEMCSKCNHYDMLGKYNGCKTTYYVRCDNFKKIKEAI
jgi:hypothetical protein